VNERARGAPRAFISHSSKDKDEFVLGFARRLRDAAVNAWVDLWEMLPGDSLAQKIFEEGLGGTDAVIAVVSENSVGSRWVAEELNTAKVLQIEDEVRLIPVLLGSVDKDRVPMVLRSSVWVRVEDPQSYDAELERVVAAIYGQTDRPPLGEPPAYATSPLRTVSGLTRTDSVVLKILGDLAVEWGEAQLLSKPDEIFAKAGELNLDRRRVEEALEVLADEGYAAVPKGHNRGTSSILAAHPTEEGFEAYLLSYLDGYEELARSVGFELVNHAEAAAPDSDELAGRLEAPVAVMRHVLRIFGREGYASIHEADGGRVFVIEVKPRLRRWLEQETRE
jgi:hypothetical protein